MFADRASLLGMGRPFGDKEWTAFENTLTEEDRKTVGAKQ